MGKNSKVEIARKNLQVFTKDLYYTAHPQVAEIFEAIDSRLWNKTRRNPKAFLKKVKSNKLKRAARNSKWQKSLKAAVRDYVEYNNVPKPEKNPVAYFCMEYGLHESIPIYSGGLGVLAGDHFKEAADMNLPFIAIGLLYSRGYFVQIRDKKKGQKEKYAKTKLNQLPLRKVKRNGRNLLIKIPIEDRIVYARVYETKLRHASLYLLDTNLKKNAKADRKLTRNLYGGNSRNRIAQELILGVGGIRLIKKLNLTPQRVHLNEGHAAFTFLERLRGAFADGSSFAEALPKIKENTLFTTHTPVPAGNETFDESLLLQMVEPYLQRMKLPKQDFLNLGKIRAEDGGFGMTVFALKTSSMANAVSKLHGEVARKMWQPLWPGQSVEEVPIGYITNGIHLKTWTSVELQELFQGVLGKNWHQPKPESRDALLTLPPNEILAAHEPAAKRLRKEIKKRNGVQLPSDAVIIGFARRFATYKRATLLLRDEERLKAILKKSPVPVVFVFAGKAHPADIPGKEFIARLIWQSTRPFWREHIVFLENYDMNLGRLMTQGADIWMNNPRRPHEASGTSGMKAAVNGVLNFSALDGWWPEIYQDNLGYAIGTERDFEDPSEQDDFDANDLYSKLEMNVLPDLNPANKENRTLKMRESIADCLPVFNTFRMLQEYNRKYYKVI